MMRRCGVGTSSSSTPLSTRRHNDLLHPLPCFRHASKGHAFGAKFISKSLLESIGRSVCLYCSCAYTMTLAPMETTPEQQMAAVWGLSSPLAAATAQQKPATGRQRNQNAQPNKFRKGMGKGGGRMAPQTKGGREMEEEEEIWMDQDMGLGEDTIRRIMRILIRSALCHEQQLTILEADRRYICVLHGWRRTVMG